MTSRARAATALIGIAAISALGMTAAGCAAMTPVATTIQYSASDGVNIPDADGSEVMIRNAILVADDEGTDGSFVGAVINPSAEPQVLTIDWGQGTERIQVPAATTLSFGSADLPPLAFANIDTPAGATIPVLFQSGSGDSVITEVPVLNGCLEQYADLTPGGIASNCERVIEVEGH